MEKTRILVVDDEEAICKITGDFLSKKNYAVLTAMNAQDAIAAVAREHPQLVLLDIRLGAESGMDVLRRIKEIDRKVKVVMVTALDDEKDIRQAKELGADDYVVKPFTAQYLSDMVLSKVAQLRAAQGPTVK